MTIRAENIPAPVEPVHPIRSRVCAWCEKDEAYIPLQDCLSCQHSRQDKMTVWCSWAPAEKPCEGCGIPAEYCEPNTCMILQAIKKSDPRCRGR